MLNHTRDVGFLRYWTVGQIPLFLLATPMLFAMLYSTYWVATLYLNPPTTLITDEDRQPLVSSPTTLERSSGELGAARKIPVSQIDLRLLIRFTLPQTLIALTCLFVAHVQIVTRLSSAYPVWYWWLAVELLDYVIFAVLLFYVLTLLALFRLRRTRPDAPRPYRAIGYPVLPALYIGMALFISGVLLRYKPQYTWPGLLIVLLGLPVYAFWRMRNRAAVSVAAQN